MNFGPLTMKLCLLNWTYPKSIVCAFSDNFRLWLHISQEWLDISKNGKRRFWPWSIPRWMQKIWWTWVHQQQSSDVSFWTTHV